MIQNNAELIGVEMVYNDRHPKPPTPIRPKSPTPPKEPTPGMANQIIDLINQIRCIYVCVLFQKIYFVFKIDYG